MEEASGKDRVECDSIHVQCPEQVSRGRQQDGCLRLGIMCSGEEEGAVAAAGTGFLWGVIKNILKLIVLIIVRLCECTRNH